MRSLSHDSSNTDNLHDTEGNTPTMEVGSGLEIEVRQLILLEDRLRKLNGNIATVNSLLKINQRSLTMMKNRMCGGSEQIRSTLQYMREEATA